MANYLFEMNEQLQKVLPGWKIAFVKLPSQTRMALLNFDREQRVSVPFPDARGENVYRALFAVLLEMAEQKYASLRRGRG